MEVAPGIHRIESELLGDPQLGPFTSLPNELASSLRAHLQELVHRGRARGDPSGLRWTTA
jgi:hypothetical protein